MKSKCSQALAHAVRLLIGVTLFASAPAQANNTLQLSCYGISNRWVDEAERFLHEIEHASNAAVNQYVSLANFQVGSDKFGIAGTASLGNLSLPPFSCENPKQTLKSGLPDFGIHPSYLLAARIFGLPVSIVDARMEGAQGQKVSADPSRKKKIIFSLKVLGVDVLQKIARGNETELRSSDDLKALVQAPNPGALPPREKVGVGGKLLDFNRSITSFTGGVAPRLDIIPSVLYVEVDAGFYLQSDLVFSYDVDSAIGNLAHGQYEVKSSLGSNPANATDTACAKPDIDPAPGMSSTANCTQISASVAPKDKSFYQKIASAYTTNRDRSILLREKVRNDNLKDLYDRAQTVRASFGDDWDKLFDGSKTLAEKKEYIEQIPMEDRMAPFKGENGAKQNELQAIGDAAKGLSSDAADAYAKYKKLIATSSNGLPEVRATAGFAVNGRAGAWASAVLAFNMAFVVQGYAGIVGYLTLLDIRAGVGATLSTKSQYMDLTAALDTVRLSGGLDLIYGVKIGISPFAVELKDRKPIFTFNGQMTRDSWLVGRLDFRAGQTGKPALFWCVDIFGGATLDPDRCSDTHTSKSILLPAAAALDDVKTNVLAEMLIDEAANCFVSDGGRPVFSSPDANNCTSLLPASATTPLTLASGEVHPLSRYFEQSPSKFMTDLRDEQNRPVKVFSANAIQNHSTGVPTSIVYAANLPMPTPFVGGLGGSVLMFTDALPLDRPDAAAPLGDRIFSIGPRAQFVSPPADPANALQELTLKDASTPELLINMDWAANAWPSDWASAITVPNPKIYVGDLGILPNDLLLDMGKNFRLGRCGVQIPDSDPNDFIVTVSSRPYPFLGDAEGKISENMSSPDDPCYIGAASGSWTQPRTAYAACVLRQALRTNECFPPDRAVDLVRLANLANQDAIRYFLGLNGQTQQISGNIYPNAPVFDSSVYQQEIGAQVRCSTQACVENIMRDFFNGQTSGLGFSHPYVHDLNRPNDNGGPSLRCNLLYIGDNNDYPYNHWFNREWITSGNDRMVIRLKSRSSSTFYRVAATANSAAPTSQTIGPAVCSPGSTSRFCARYEAPHTNRNQAVICDPSDINHRDRYADTALNAPGSNLRTRTLAQSSQADAPGSVANDLARAIKTCIANDHQCVYTPEGSTEDAAQLANATCEVNGVRMGGTGTPGTFKIPGPSGTSSLNACLYQSTNPNFSDAQTFCNDARVKTEMFRVAGINPSQSSSVNAAFSLTGDWDLSRSVTNLGDSGRHESREIGRCFLTRQSGSTLVEITGQTADMGRDLASVSSGPRCSLSLEKDTGPFVLRADPYDPVPAFDPTATDARCAETLGFGGTSAQNQTKANEYCSTLGSADLVDVFAPYAYDLTNGNPTDAKVGQATLHYQIIAGLPGTGAVGTQTCQVTRTVAEWTTLLGRGDCKVTLSPTNGSVALPQTVRLPLTTSGRSSCEQAVDQFMDCSRVRTVSAYIPFASSGVTMRGFYANNSVGSLPQLSCNPAPYAPNGDNTWQTDCRLGGWMSIPSKPYASASPEFDTVFIGTQAEATNLRSDESDESLVTQNCNSVWYNRVQSMSSGGNPANFLFCASTLDAVGTALYNRRNTLFNCNGASCPTRTGLTWTTSNGSAPITGTLPITLNLRSHYQGGSVTNWYASPNDPLVDSCHYEFQPLAGSAGSFLLVTEGTPMNGATPDGYGDAPTTAQCIRPTAAMPSPNDPNAACLTIAPGSTLLFGGAGPGLLAQVAPGITADFAQRPVATCDAYLPKIAAVSDLVQPDATKRFPMFVATADAQGRVTIPRETDPATFYCQPAPCQLMAEFGNESREIDHSFLWSIGFAPATSTACHAANAPIAQSACLDLRLDKNVPDNLPIQLFSSFAGDRQLLQTCAPTEPRACVIGAARDPRVDFYVIGEKPAVNPGVLSVTGHPVPFGSNNTAKACAEYFGEADYCAVANPYQQDPDHPGMEYSIFRKFGVDQVIHQTCYSALKLALTPESSGNGMLSEWTDSDPADGQYELQYCEGSGCIPGSAGSLGNTNTLATANGETFRIPSSSGSVVRARVRLVLTATSTHGMIALPWSNTAEATTLGTPASLLAAPTFTADVYGQPRDRIVFQNSQVHGNYNGYYEYVFCSGAWCNPRDVGQQTGKTACWVGQPSCEIQPNHPQTYGIAVRFVSPRTSTQTEIQSPWSRDTAYVTTDCIVYDEKGWAYCDGTGPGTSTHPSGSTEGDGHGPIVDHPPTQPPKDPRTHDELLLDACLRGEWSACTAYLESVGESAQAGVIAKIRDAFGGDDSFLCSQMKVFCQAGSGVVASLDELRLRRSIPETLAWAGVNGEGDGEGFTADFDLIPLNGVTYECRLGQAQKIRTADFTACDGDQGTLPKLVLPRGFDLGDGSFRLEARAALGAQKGRTIATNFFVDRSLEGVAACQPALSDDRYFAIAGEKIEHDSKFDAETKVNSYPLLTLGFADEGTVRISTLRRRMVMSKNQDLVLFKRAYESNDGSKCGNVNLGSASAGEVSETCQAIVFNASGLSLCFDEDGNPSATKKGVAHEVATQAEAAGGVYVMPDESSKLAGKAPDAQSKSVLCRFSNLFCPKVGASSAEVVKSEDSGKADQEGRSTAGTSDGEMSDPVTNGPANGTDAVEIDRLSSGERRIFLTSKVFDGNLGGLSGADAQCQARAQSAGLSRKYRAVLSDGKTSAEDRLPGTQAVYQFTADGKKVLVVKTWNAFFERDFVQEPVVSVDEFGKGLTGVSTFWIATDRSGRATSQTCGSWSSSARDEKGDIGSTNRDEVFGWEERSNCSATQRLLCISD